MSDAYGTLTWKHLRSVKVFVELYRISGRHVTFFNVPLENKDAVAPNPLTKEESHCVYKCDCGRLSGSTKRWIFKSM